MRGEYQIDGWFWPSQMLVGIGCINALLRLYLIINIQLMEQNTTQTQKFWRLIGNHAELVFEQGAAQSDPFEQLEGKNYDPQNGKELLPSEIEDDEAYLISEGPSREIIQLDQNEQATKIIEATIKEEAFILDQTSNVYLRTSRNGIPDILVTINESFIKKSTNEQKQEECNIVIEVMLCEKSSCPQRQKLKILKGGITGCSRKKVHQKNKIQFRGLKFNYNSNPDKNSKLLIALYKINKERIRTYVQILVSRDIFLIEDGKAITIETYDSLFQYFENFTVDFMERPPMMVRINKNDKHPYHEEISTFEKYLIKKNKKVAHIVYLAFKFPHFVELYFRNDQKSEGQKNLNQLLSNALKEILAEISVGKYSESEKQLVCNHFNPDAKIVLSINANMRKVRFFMRKQFTRLISIIASEEQPNYQNYQKFSSNKQLKEFYLQYYANTIKCKSPALQTIPKPQTVSPPPTVHPHLVNSPLNGGLLHYENLNSDKKNINGKRVADDDYHQDEEEELAELDSDQSQNYSLSEKKVRKNTKKSDLRKNQIHYTGVNSKDIKYPTRNKTRQLENQDQDDKKGILSKKIKEKQLLQQQQPQQIKKPTQPGMSGNMFIGGGMPGNMPFQIVNPQNPQMQTMGMFPMMQGLQMPPGMGMPNPNSKDGNPTQGKAPNPMQMNPQMMGMMPAGMFGMPGGMPGQMGGMMGQPLGMFNPANMMQPNQKKQGTGKDGKDEQTNPALKQQMPAMMPMGINPAMLGMQGMQIPAGMALPQGMMPNGMQPIAMPGPNGTIMLMMPSMMGQNPGQNPTGGQGATQFSQMPGMGTMPPGFALAQGMGSPYGAIGMNLMNPNQGNQNPNDNKNQNPTGMNANPMMMGMPQMNPAMLNQMMLEQNKSFLQKKDQPNPSQNQNLNQQPQTNSSKTANSQFNQMQKPSGNTDSKNPKKDEKPEGNFPPNMQNLMGMGMSGGFGQGQNPQMMMFPQGLASPGMMQMMQGSGFGASKDKTQQNDKQGGMPQGINPQMMGQLGMGFGPMISGNTPQGMTPEMLQQLSQSQNGPQMMQMAMLPPGFQMPGGQGQNQGQMGQNPQGQQGQTGMQGMNPMALQGGAMGQMNAQNFNEMMRQQQAIQEMMKKGGMFMQGMPGMPGMQGGMPAMQGMQGTMGGMPGMGVMPGMGGMGGMFMPPKKDEQDKKQNR